MSLYGIVVALHVVVAVVGIGMLGAIPLGARVARRAGAELATLQPIYVSLYRITGVSLLVMLLTGVVLDVLVSGIHHERGWFQAAFVLWFLTGMLHGRASLAIRQGLAGKLSRARALGRVELFGWLGSVLVLMKLKPF